MKLYTFNSEIAKIDSPKIHYRANKKPTSSWFISLIIVLLIAIYYFLYYYIPTPLFIFTIFISTILLIFYIKNNKIRRLTKAPTTVFLEKDDNIYLLEGNIKNVKLLHTNKNEKIFIQKMKRLNQLFNDQEFLEDAFLNPNDYSMVTIYHINNTSNIKEMKDYYQVDCMLMNLKTSRLKGSRIYIGKCYQNYPELIKKIKQK